MRALLPPGVGTLTELWVKADSKTLTSLPEHGRGLRRKASERDLNSHHESARSAAISCAENLILTQVVMEIISSVAFR
jgi:hypothetical protein